MQANDISFWSPLKAVIKVSGRNATSFLHRMSTNDVENMQKNERFINCFVNQKGRLIDVVYQKELKDGSWQLISAHANSQILSGWLEGYLFSEDVIIEDISTKTDFGSDFKNKKLSEFERIKRSLPAAPNEICEKFNPYELGLGKSIAFNKGCYLGQEVLSRLDTYDKVTRQLVSISCSEEDYEALKESAEVTSCFKEARQIVALGVFKKTALTSAGIMTTQNGTKVWVVSSAR